MTLFNFQKQKIDSKSYKFKINGIAVCNKAIHDTFLSLKNMKKGDIVKKCPGSLYYPLLPCEKF